jgi:hypothetical protein
VIPNETLFGWGFEKNTTLNSFANTHLVELRATKATATIERVPYDYEPPDEDTEPEDRIKGPPVVCKCTKRLSDRVAVMATKPKKPWWTL